jgi:hypothetical protein
LVSLLPHPPQTLARRCPEAERFGMMEACRRSALPDFVLREWR